MDWVSEFFDDEFFAADFAMMKDEDPARTQLEASFIAAQLQLKSDMRVLDLACGFGRHALALAPRVAEVIGTDRTASYIELARNWAAERGIGNASFHVLDMRDLDYHVELDAIYSYFTAWGYYDDATNFDVLRRIRAALKPGGSYLLEFINRDGEMRRHRPYGWVKRRDGVIVLYKWWLDFNTGRYHTHHTFIDTRVADPAGRVREIEIDHALPTSDEFIRLFKRAGFADARLVSAPDGGDLTLNSRRLAIIGTAAE